MWKTKNKKLSKLLSTQKKFNIFSLKLEIQRVTSPEDYDPLIIIQLFVRIGKTSIGVLHWCFIDRFGYKSVFIQRLT